MGMLDEEHDADTDQEPGVRIFPTRPRRVLSPATTPEAESSPSRRRNRPERPGLSPRSSIRCWPCRTKTRRVHGRKQCATSTHIDPIGNFSKVSISHGAVDRAGQWATGPDRPRSNLAHLNRFPGIDAQTWDQIR